MKLTQFADLLHRFDHQNVDYRQIADRVRELSGASFVVLNRFNSDGESFSTKAISGDRKYIQKAIDLLGFNFLEKKWPFDEQRQKLVGAQKTTVFEKLSDLTANELPNFAIDRVSSFLGLGRVYVVVTRNEGVKGDLTLIYAKGEYITNQELVESCIDLIGMAYSRLEAERILAEQKKELELKNTQLEKLSFNLPGFMYQYQMSADGSSCFPYASENIRRIYEVSPSEVMRDASLAIARIFEPDRQRVMDRITESYRTLQNWDDEYRVLLPERGLRWVWGSAHPETQGDGSVIWHGYITDVTDRKLMEDALRNDRNLLDSVITATNAGIWQWDIPSGNSVYNDRWAAMLGYTLDALRPLSIETLQRLAHPQDYEQTRLLLEKHFSGESEYYASEIRMQHKNGDWVWVLARGQVSKRDRQGRPLEMLGIHLDISESKRNEMRLIEAKQEAEKASRAKSEFLANMSHEIRTPLNGVIGFNELLSRTALNSVQRQYVENAIVSGHALLDIINNILDLSKIEAGRLELDLIRTDIIELAGEVSDMMAYQASVKNLELELQVDPATPRFALIDPVRVRQILVNLVGNAVKFTEKGLVQVSLRFIADGDIAGASLKGRFEFSVRDTGVGIQPEQRERLFKAFSQGDASVTRKYGGTGLGLVISNSLSLKMGSSILFESEPGVGSRFWFDIHTEADRKPACVIITPPHLRRNMPICALNPVILIAEDIRLNMILVKTLVLQAIPGATILQAENGTIAVTHFQQQAPDLILMDVQMPEMDGIAACKAIRADEQRVGAVKRVPIIALTAGALREERERCLESGMDDFLTKPIEPDKLTGILQTFLCASESSR